ncbi:MAG: methyl-accepting chemotaxis protein, partial [Candidatus Hodarchaeales archaeon]
MLQSKNKDRTIPLVILTQVIIVGLGFLSYLTSPDVGTTGYTNPLNTLISTSGFIIPSSLWCYIVFKGMFSAFNRSKPEQIIKQLNRYRRHFQIFFVPIQVILALATTLFSFVFFPTPGISLIDSLLLGIGFGTIMYVLSYILLEYILDRIFSPKLTNILTAGEIIPFTTLTILQKFLLASVFTLLGLELFTFRTLVPDSSILDISVVIYLIVFSIVPLITLYVFYKTVEPKFEEVLKNMSDMLSKDIKYSDKVLVPSQDNLGNFSQSFYGIANYFSSVLQSMHQSADHLANTSTELATTFEDVNALSEKIAATIQQISRGASNQSELSLKAINDLDKMSDSVDQSLNDIEGTLQVIDDIAGQTNILALNAAIEAARAGEYGRGFAVVSDNVRRLAEETKINATDITKLTDKIVSSIGGSITKLQETLQSFATQSEELSASSEEVAAAT